MKFKTTTAFDNDFKKLRPDHRKKFRQLMPVFNAACDAYIADVGGFVWPGALRVSQMSRAEKVWEMTWSFTGPDGRATFEFIDIDGEPGVRWRRIGGHDIYDAPLR